MQQHHSFGPGYHRANSLALQNFGHRWEGQIVAARVLVTLAQDGQVFGLNLLELTVVEERHAGRAINSR